MGNQQPTAADGFVCYEQGSRPILYDAHEAEALALSLLGAATEARAQQLAADGYEYEHDRAENQPETAEKLADRQHGSA